MNIAIREIQPDDGDELAKLMTALARETPNSLLTESESMEAGKSQHERIEYILTLDNQRFSVACDGPKLVGLIGLTQGLFQRNKHCCSLMIGLLADYWGRGVAGRLFDQGMTWARIRGVSRIEVGVLESNDRAIAFYERKGFTREGIKEQALRINEQYVNEILMAKFLRTEAKTGEE